MEFSFKKFAVAAERTARLPLEAISEDPRKPITLELRHAGEGNRAFMSAVLKGVNAPRSRSGRGVLTLAALAQGREDDAALYAKHVVVGWENVLTRDGKPAPCEPEVVERFLLAVADPKEGRPDVFDLIRSFAQNPENFRDPSGSPEELGKG